MNILQKNNKKLRITSEYVAVFDKELKKFAMKLAQTMNFNNGCGIASPQVGKNIRLIVARIRNKNMSFRIGILSL